MEPKLIERAAFTVMGVVDHFDSAGSNFGPLWQAFMGFSEQLDALKAGEGHYGVYLGVDHSQPLDYLAGMAVQADAAGFQSVVKHGVPAAYYAVFTCDFPQIGPTYGHIFNEWLPQSKYQQDGDALGFDYYPPGMAEGAKVEIWFPVKPK